METEKKQSGQESPRRARVSGMPRLKGLGAVRELSAEGYYADGYYASDSQNDTDSGDSETDSGDSEGFHSSAR